MLTYQAIVAVRYPELVLHEPNHIYIGHFVPHEATVAQGGFRTVLWNAPKDLRAAVEDVVAFCTYLKNYYRDLQQGATSQLLVLCNRTAVHNLLLQHGFQSAWYGGLRVSTTSSAAGATARIAVIVQTGVGFLSGGRRDASADEREDCYGRATVALTRAIEHTYIVSPLDMAGMIGMAQTIGVYHYGYFTLKGRDIQYHGPSKYPSDKSAILDWGLVAPFISQDKPPLAIAMIVTTNGTRVWRRYRLVVACRDKLRLPPDVLAALESRTRDHVLTTSGFFPCSIDREYLYGYAADGYRSPLWLCAAYNGSPALVHRHRGHKVFFHVGIQDRQLVVIPGIHYFDAHRLQPDLLATLDRQFDPGSMNFASPEGAGDTVNDPSSDEEAASTDAESDPEDPTVAWCPPIPDAAEDPSEDEIVSAADQLAILITNVQPNGNPFCIPENLGILPPLWLQARLTLSLTAIQEKFARILLSVACELWLRGQSASVEDVLLQTARALTIRLAEKLAQAMSTLMRSAESMVTPETECLLYATYWFRPILSELIGSARESSERNRSRAPSGPVKVLVTDRPHRRTTGLVDLTSGASALLAWFPASWASKIAPKLLENAPENAQKPQEINIACPKRSCDETPVEGAKQLLQAVKFAAKTMPGFRLGLDEDFQMAGCFQELIHGYTSGLVEPYMMRGLQPLGPTRTTLEVIIPSQEGLTPEKWKETATLCPLDWPSNYSLLRLWHTNGSLHQTVARLRNQLSHSHMFAEWTVHLNRFAERVLFQQPAVYVAGHALQANLRERTFPDRKGRRRVPPEDLDEHQRAIRALHQRAIAQQAANPVSFALTNEWNDTITSDKKHHLEHFMRGTT